MKRKILFLIGILTSGIIGWTLGFLRLPYLEKNFSFLLGFIAGASIISLVLILLSIFQKKSKTKETSSNSQFLKSSIMGIILFGIISSSFFIFSKNQISKTKTKTEYQALIEQSKLMESTKKSNAMILMNSLINEINQELKSNPKNKLSQNIIERIIALNTSFKPYRIVEGDSLSKKELSPERGLLLLNLIALNMDSSSFNLIKEKVTFSGADLRKIDLSGKDLSGINLTNASLKNANLSKANLTKANLSDSNLWGANLKEAILQEAILHRINLRWAELDKANLNNANLNGANLNNAKLTKTNLIKVNMEWAISRNTFFTQSDLSGSNLTGTNMEKAILHKTNLSNATMKLVNLSYAILDEANLNNTELGKTFVFDKQWIKKLKAWNIKGAKEIEEIYKTIDDVSGQFKFRIVKK